MVGLFDKFVPKFVKQYTNIRQTILNALKAYKDDVMSATFPGSKHSFKMTDDALEQLRKLIKR
jgi:3-methyl-2-oxobutanoate hydroxymethyltransferase